MHPTPVSERLPSEAHCSRLGNAGTRLTQHRGHLLQKHAWLTPAGSGASTALWPPWPPSGIVLPGNAYLPRDKDAISPLYVPSTQHRSWHTRGH